MINMIAIPAAKILITMPVLVVIKSSFRVQRTGPSLSPIRLRSPLRSKRLRRASRAGSAAPGPLRLRSGQACPGQALGLPPDRPLFLYFNLPAGFLLSFFISSTISSGLMISWETTGHFSRNCLSVSSVARRVHVMFVGAEN